MEHTRQFAFEPPPAEANERASQNRDLHSGRVQAFFGELSKSQKLTLGRHMTEHECDTCLALSVAACDWHRSRPHDRQVARAIAGMEAAVKKIESVG